MIYPVPHFLPAGDAAVIVEFGDEISPVANELVRGLDAVVATAAVPGILETIPAYRSLLVEYDPQRLSFDEVTRLLRQRAAMSTTVERVVGPLREVPVAYGGECGADLLDVAAVHNLSPEEVVALHAGTDYSVYMLGFSPGFAFMGSVPESISTPRLATPRTEVPAGSVGIAGRQTGVYPHASPGGWRLIGRTNLVLFDPLRDPPSFFQPGDRVRFRPVDVKSGAWEHSQQISRVSHLQDPHASPSFEVLEPGLLTTVQDLGRPGHQRLGVPVSGAMDSWALRAANLLVGNPAGAAALELTVLGPAIRFLSDALIAVTGADLGALLECTDRGAWEVPQWQAVFVRRGTVLRFRGRRSGCRAYLGLAGGIAAPTVMGSRSTYLVGGFGGQDGRALRAGDVLSAGAWPGDPALVAGRWLVPDDRPRYGDRPVVRVVLGPQEDHFGGDGVSTFLSSEYQVSTASNRMGLRLEGPSILHAGPSEIVSSGIALGAVQVPPDGQPIVLMADRQTAGGYPVVGTVVRADMPLLAQCLPGYASVRFRSVSVEEAQASACQSTIMRLSGGADDY